ncbi:isoleucine--tRNA ligase [bacterium]|nr:isoleucine--tRNA ligase [bacterium]
MTDSDQAKDYRKTVLTPKTDFPQRGSLPTREPEMLEHWKEIGLAKKISESRASAPEFVLHDGPPYANGDIHIGHALNKGLKDFVVRYKTMAGFRCNYIPGWDCHGLPIEQKVLELIRSKGDTSSDALDIRTQCAEYAKKWAAVQSEQFQRLGVGGEWDRPYMTLDPEYEVEILNAFGALVGKGLVHKGFKPVHWDPVFETALAEAEIEYNEEHVSHTIYLRFPLYENELPQELAGVPKPTIVIWTTTPWTIPANMGVAMHANFDYVAYQLGDESLIIAKDLLEPFLEETGLSGGKVVAEFKGAILEGKHCHHPVFPERPSLVMMGEHVTMEATGIVHTAPAHGVEDFMIGKEYGLEVFNPVDEKGCYTDLYPEMQGTNVFDANPKLIEKFKSEGTLVHAGKITHSYPYSWRSRKPVIMRATEQWFMNLNADGLREKALDEIENVQWIPAWGRDRIFNMVQGRPDWCLSRQRSWGVPIPSIHDKQTGHSVLTKEIVDKFVSYVREEGTDCWFRRPVEDFLPEEMKAEDGRYEKESNILDVWFDSGASHFGVLEPRENLSWPADLYLEGADQHRGWFQSSLWISVGVRGCAPYRAVLTHGFVLDEQGRPMSKSLGNVVSPLEVIDQMGADVLRLWIASEEYRSDLAASKGLLQQVSGVYRRVRNTIRFLLGNLSDFDPSKHSVPYAEMEEDDQWMLAKLDDLTRRIRRAYDDYEFHRVYHLVNGFCVTELGGIYLDCSKDRLYCSAADGKIRRAAQTVIYELATHLLRMLAPIMPFTSDEGWSHLPTAGRVESVHMADFPAGNDAWKNAELLGKYEKLLAVRTEVQRAIEALRSGEEKLVRNSLEAAVSLKSDDAATLEFLKSQENLARLFIVSRIAIEEEAPSAVPEALAAMGLKVGVTVTRVDGEKCNRCWVYAPEVGQDSEHPSLCARCADAVRSMTT